MLKPGQMFGNYRIVEKIGVGGMGSVYLAEHPTIGKQVALKVIHRELSANREVITRFFNEAKAANQIGNEHIVNIHDFGQTPEGEHFYIMEYLEGRTLAQVLQQTPMLSAHRVLHITAQMASGLDSAHRINIIHRDLKPDNVILVNRMGDADFVKILDFGLAKVLDAEQKLTAAGVVLGTPQYMSPEACESRSDIDHRCDVYSMGILMFQMLCGKVPFTGETMGEVLIKQVTKLPPAPRALNPAVPPSVEQIVLRCLAKDRGMRFESMQDLRAAVLAPEKYLASSPPVIPSSGEAPSSSPKNTQFFGGGAPQNHPGIAPPQASESLGPPPEPRKKTAFLGSAESVIETLPPIETANHPPPAHAMKTQYSPEANAPAAPPPAHAAKTAFMDGGAAAGAAPPRAKRESVKTAFMGPGAEQGHPPPAEEGQAGPSAKTAFMAPQANGAAGAATQFLGPGADVGAPPAAPPELSPPTPAHNHTMAIAPPEGYKEHPPRGSSPIWIGVGVAIAVAGFGVLGFAYPGFLVSKNDAAAERPAEVVAAKPIDAAPPPKPIDAAPPAPKPKMVVIELVSKPSGARVVDDRGVVLLEKTPGKIEVPMSEEELLLTFRHPRRKSKTTTVVPSADTRVRLELSRKRGGSRNGGSGSGSGSGSKDPDGTMNPF